MKVKFLQVIDWVGLTFRVDARYFVKNSFWLLVGQFIMSAVAFVLTVVLANFISKKDLGDYRLIVSLATMLVFFTMSGLSQAFIRSIVKGMDGALREALTIKRYYGFVAFVIGAGIAAYFGIYKENAVFGLSIFIMAACLPLMEMYSLYLGYLQGKHEFKFTSISQAIVKTVSGIAVICAAIFTPSLVYLIIALYGTQVLLLSFFYKYTLWKYPPLNNDTDASMKMLAQHMTISGIPIMLFGQADKFILYHFFGPVALASYWVASAIPQEIGRVMSTVSQVAFPKFVQGEHSILRKTLPKKILIATLVLLTVSILYSFIAYPIFLFFFPLYITEVGMSIVLMFAFSIVPYMFIWQYYAAQGNVKVVYISNTVDPVLQIILYILLIPLFGVWGLVYAVFIKMICMNLLAWYVLKVH